MHVHSAVVSAFPVFSLVCYSYSYYASHRRSALYTTPYMMDIPTPSRTKHGSIIDAYFRRIHTLKPSDAFLLKAALLASIVFAFLLLIQVSALYSTDVATSGGTYTEGIVGTPRFVNPVLAVTRADKDLTTLIYDGLMRVDTEGVLVPNVAESVTVSEDGLTYNIILKRDVRFHDDTPLTARDVAFTIGRIQEPLLASPLRSNFDGITVEEVSEYEINLVLREAYSPFIENLTFGILPEHIWRASDNDTFTFSQHNTEPIGSGPFAVKDIIFNTSGTPEIYVLEHNEQYHLGAPKIRTVKLHFFPTDERLLQGFGKGLVEGVAGVNPTQLAAYDLKPEMHDLIRTPLPRTFGVFFNQNKSPALRDSAARRALDLAINRTTLVTDVMLGYGMPVTTPIPPGFGIEAPMSETPYGDIDAAREVLTTGGWKFNAETQLWEKSIDSTLTPLTFSIATLNNSNFEATAEFLRGAWGQLGVPVTIKQFEQADLTQAVVRPRDYEALLFGTQLGRPLDFYSFWHSSQRNDPGLNIALYTNITTDALLAEMRRDAQSDARVNAIQQFATEMTRETPAVFLYTPELLYILPTRIIEAPIQGINEPHERFMNIHAWYIETESVWPFFRTDTE